MAPEAVKWLVEAARWAPSADNTQPWRFSWDGRRLFVHYDSVRVKNLTFSKEHPATLLSGGAVIENLGQMMCALGIPTSSLSFGHPSSCELASVLVTPNLKVGPELAQHPLFSRHTNRFPFRSNAADPETWMEISQLCDDVVRLRIYDDVAGMGRIADLVSQASAIRFQTKEVHEWLGRSLRFSTMEVGMGDGLDVATFDLPPGGKMFLRIISDWGRMRQLNRVGAYRLLAEMEAKPIRQAPALVAIIGKSGDSGAMATGRILERIWIELNRRGLAVQPFFVVSDQIFRLRANQIPESLAKEALDIDSAVKKEFTLNGESLYMILRVGQPKHAPIRSRRLPTERIFSIEPDMPT